MVHFLGTRRRVVAACQFRHGHSVIAKSRRVSNDALSRKEVSVKSSARRQNKYGLEKRSLSLRGLGGSEAL